MKSPTHSFSTVSLVVATLLALCAQASSGQSVSGTYVANSKTVELRHALAMEIDSDTEPGYLDVLVLLTDREITEEQAKSQETLERLSFKEGLSGIRLLLDPDCKVKQIGPYHPTFKVFVVNHSLPEWSPSAYDETVAGKLRQERQSDYGQTWEYDLTFDVPIIADPEAIDTSAPRP